MRGNVWVFGLSIDEEVTWAAAKVDLRTLQYSSAPGDVKQGTFGKLPSLTEYDSDVELDLREWLDQHVDQLKKTEGGWLSQTASIGVSSIGVVDSKRAMLRVIDRKRWRLYDQNTEYSHIVDFRAFFSASFGRTELRISVQNDATAKCLAELEVLRRLAVAYPQKHEVPDLLFYGSFHDGVNGSFAHYKKNVALHMSPIVAMMHQELGHVSPPLHAFDCRTFRKRNSGCPIHTHCFVGLASGVRVRRQWKKTLPELEHHQHAWPVISHYVSHFCYNAVLTLAPSRILLGGSMIDGKMIPRIRHDFDVLNFIRGRPYIDYPEMRRPDFISLANLSPEKAGMLGALELARRGLLPDDEPLRLLERQ